MSSPPILWTLLYNIGLYDDVKDPPKNEHVILVHFPGTSRSPVRGLPRGPKLSGGDSP